MAADLNALMGRTPPRMPFWWFIVQCVTIALSFAVFVASCYALANGFGGGPAAFLLFDCLMIFIFVGGFIAIERFQPAWYFRIVFVISYALIIIFVLSGWAWAASWASAYLSSVCYMGRCYGAGSTGVGAALAVGAAFGAVIWILMIVSLVFYILACLREGTDVVTADAPDAEMGAVKTEQPAAAAPVDQQYAQQTYQDPAYTQQQQQPYPPQQQQPYPPQQQQGPYNS